MGEVEGGGGEGVFKEGGEGGGGGWKEIGQGVLKGGGVRGIYYGCNGREKGENLQDSIGRSVHPLYPFSKSYLSSNVRLRESKE